VTVVEAENGFKVLQALMVKNEAALPQMVLLGANTGLLSGAVLIDKIRKLPNQSHPRVISVCTEEQERDATGLSAFDGFIRRTQLPEALLAEFDSLWGAPRGLRSVLQRYPRFRSDLASDVVAVMQTRLQVSVLPTDATEPLPDGAMIEGHIALTSDQPPLTLDLTVQTARHRARNVVGRMLQREAEQVSDDELGTVVGSAIVALAGRVEHRLGEFGLTTRPQPAEVRAPKPAAAPVVLGFRDDKEPAVVMRVALAQAR
jgi:hypothetical protein